ncbi:A-factor biosynthesis hotdog protein [Breoghania corrubedonensis]|uniref:A-factor biosynthesis hotdog protein n=1 Tax=Breoghania corrubedonensis TaxID=665038 RepID=A0A2T5VE48_9HYPH|nr:AfsA-related hotdog domain-containing protein [Breoghania corrubedonensis]PTW62032.1 A-factor biosynthesis hotdog protein [Breoghania corrubedonensis]
MAKDVAILVGDRFDNFARNPEVFCLSDFMATTRLGAPVEKRVCLGQGLSPEEVEELGTVVPSCAMAGTTPQRADHALTHKRVAKNIMISPPRRIEADRFVADLLLDDENEVIADHQTGQHIQGLALIEAARQTWTAVSEAFLLNHDRPTRFVLESVNSSFESFLFPLPAELSLELLEVSRAPMQSVFHVRVVVTQVDRTAATIEARYRVIDERINDRQETFAARAAVEAFLSVGEAELVEAE